MWVGRGIDQTADSRGPGKGIAPVHRVEHLTGHDIGARLRDRTHTTKRVVQFDEIARRDALPQVMRGLQAIAAFPEVRPIKVNAIAMRDFTEEEIHTMTVVNSARIAG